jgi:ABC-2 type transport system permease protein
MSVYAVGVYLRLIGARIRGQMQYRVSFLLETMAQFFATFLDFAMVFLIFDRIPSLRGWSLGEVALLYGLTATAFAIEKFIGRGFDVFHRKVARGDFDGVLIRPWDTFFLILADEFPLRRFGRLGQAVLVLGFAFRSVGLRWTWGRALYLPLVLCSGCAFYLAVIIVQATACFWTVQAVEFTNIFSYGGTMMASYPLEIYADWFRKFFTFIVPLAFVSYFPALYLLEKPDPLGFPRWFAFLTPPVCLAVLGLAIAFWHYGVRHYQSTGS